MAQKPVKKAAAKQAPAKKAPAKKTTARKPAAQAAAPQATVTMETSCGCNNKCGCGCRRGGFWRFIGKLLILVIVFALGFACAKMMCACKMQHKMHGDFPRPEFVNGCMDVSAIRNPQAIQRVALADLNGDGCITKEEFKTVKREMRRQMRDDVREEIREEIVEEFHD